MLHLVRKPLERLFLYLKKCVSYIELRFNVVNNKWYFPIFNAYVPSALLMHIPTLANMQWFGLFNTANNKIWIFKNMHCIVYSWLLDKSFHIPYEKLPPYEFFKMSSILQFFAKSVKFLYNIIFSIRSTYSILGNY